MTNEYFQIVRNKIIFSKYLNREVTFDLILPKHIKHVDKFATVYMNDGQDLDKLAPINLCTRHYKNNGKPFIWVSIHTNENRMQEYGTSYILDYRKRGAKATDYMLFITKEMMPYMQKNKHSSSEAADNFFCGFSLGALSAFDIVWENPTLFSKAGVFSGSLWWRSKSYEEGFIEDNDLIMHNKVKDAGHKEGLKFWFECGTLDETEDRNNNGVIDSIDDTLDLISTLHSVGYTEDDTTYLEVKGGHHNFNTWQAVFYDFLSWTLNT